MNLVFPAHRALLAALAIAFAGGGLVAPATAEELAEDSAEPIANLTIIGQRDDANLIAVDPLNTPQTLPTTGDLLKRMPGGNLNYNGPLTGIAQYRGMYSYRLNTTVDDVPIISGGPNWMDAPLHYAPMPILDQLEVQRGITSVSAGNETIGGNVQAKRQKSEFGATSEFELHGGVNASAQTADSGYGVGVLIAGSNDTQRIHATGVLEQGDDTEFANGTTRPTEYDRIAWGLGYGLSLGSHEIGLDFMRNETSDSGTPALPMDIRYVDTNIISGNYGGEIGIAAITAKLYYNEVEHLMDNFTLRDPQRNPMQRRQNFATGDNTGFALGSVFDLGAGELGVGVDGDMSNHDARITNPSNAMFFVDNFNDVERNRYGIFAEWNTSTDETWSYQIGGRYTRVDADAGVVDGTPANLPPPPGMMMNPAAGLRDDFNNANRALDWDLVDAVGKLYFRLSDSLRLDVGVGHKERAPAYQELYLWLPLQATAGLADGRNYVGNLDLKQEKSNEIDIGLDWRTGGTFIGPRVFYKRVDDYIQGTPATDPRVIMVSNAMSMMMGNPNPPPPLQFNNVDAEFYGIDADFGVELPANLRIDGVVSYVRGKRRDIDDNLYRIAPLTSVVAMTFDQPNWSITAEGQFASQQDKVSVTNGETETAGYGIGNLYGSVRFMERLLLTLGVNNVFDKEYRDHTNGVNRVMNSDVAVGERLPGPGISFFGRVRYNW